MSLGLWYGNNLLIDTFLCVLIWSINLWLFLKVCWVLFNSKHLVAPIWVKSCSMIVMDVWKMCFYVMVKLLDNVSGFLLSVAEGHVITGTQTSDKATLGRGTAFFSF